VPVSQPTTSQPSSLGRQAKRGAKAAGSVVYAGLHPEHVNTLTIGGAPIDTHAGQFAVQEWTRLLARRNELAVYRTLVRLGGGVQRGKHQLTGFKFKWLEPGAQLERLTGLLANIHDPDYVDSAGLPASPDRCPR